MIVFLKIKKMTFRQTIFCDKPKHKIIFFTIRCATSLHIKFVSTFFFVYQQFKGGLKFNI
jgi:hypothetical protein